MLHRVDAEPIYTEVDPVLVHLREAVNDNRVLGHQVIESREVTVEDAFSLEGGVAAVVINRRIIEPGGYLAIHVLGGHGRGVGE